MKYWRRMMLAPSLESERAALYRKFRRGRPVGSVWVIALPEDTTHLMDIYPYRTLLQKHYRRSGQLVIAAASSKEEAEELSAAILAGVYRETGSFSVSDCLFSAGKEPG